MFEVSGIDIAHQVDGIVLPLCGKGKHQNAVISVEIECLVLIFPIS